MRFQPPKGDHKMITGKKCPKSYFIAKLQAVRQGGNLIVKVDMRLR